MKSRFPSWWRLTLGVLISLARTLCPAADIVWTNANSSVWNAVTNWSPNQVPGSADNVHITNSGTYTVTLNVAATVGTLELGGVNGTQTLTNNAFTLTLNGAALVETNGVFGINAGSVTGTGSLDVAGRLIWTGGTISGAGITTIASNGTLVLGGGTKTLSGRTLINQGHGTWSSGNLNTGSGAVFSNASSGTFDITFDSATVNAAGSRTFANAGLLRKTGGSGNSSFSELYHNSGEVQIQSGTVSLTGGGTHTGVFLISDGSTLAMSAAHTFTNGCTVAGAGTLQLTSGASTFNGPYAVTNGGVIIAGATVNFNGAGTASPTNLTVSSGTLGGSNSVNVSALMVWSGGTISGTNSVTAHGGLTVNGTTKVFTGRTLVNASNATWSAGQITFGGGAIFSNAPSGTVDVSFDAVTASTIGSGTILNAGLIRKTSGAGSWAIPVPFRNSGTVEILSGTLNFSVAAAIYTQTSGLTLLNGGNINNSAPLRIEGGLLAGSGTITGSATNSGTVAPGASPGLLTITGAYTQTTNGVLNIELAGTAPGTSFDRLAVGGNARLAGTLQVSLTNGYTPAADTFFTFLTCATRSNTFNSFGNSSSTLMQLVYSNNSVSIEANYNVPPTIPPIADKTLDELTLLSVAVNATDDNLPPQSLSYALTNSPLGATIDSSGLLTWTPGEVQGPMTTNITVVVTDNGTPNRNNSRTFQVIVNETNAAPLLAVPSNQSVSELVLLTLTNIATDADIPANPLTFALVNGPTGAVLNASSGVLTWTPSEAQGPGTNLIIVSVTDTNVGALAAKQISVTNSFTIVVNESNRAPVLGPISNRTIGVLDPLIVTNAATDSDLPANSLTYSFLSAPASASVNANGVITWTPAIAQGDSTNTFTTVVSDFNPAAINAQQLSATNAFTVVVNSPDLAPRLTINRTGTNVLLSWPITRITHDLEFSELISPANWAKVLTPPSVAANRKNVQQLIQPPKRFFRLQPVPSSPPTLANLIASTTVAVDGAGSWGFDYSDPDADIAFVDFVHYSALGPQTNRIVAWLLGVTNVSGTILVPLPGSTMPFGTNTFFVQLRDSGDHVSQQLSFTTTVIGSNASGVAPSVQNLTASPAQWNRPTGTNDEALSYVSFTFADPDADILRARVLINGPAGLTGSELHASGIGISGTSGVVTLQPLTFHASNPLGAYAIEVTLFDRQGHASAPTNTIINLLNSGGQIPLAITSFTPTNGGPGTLVTIKGGGFDTNVVNNTVELNSTPLNVLTATPTNLVVEIPELASSGRLIVSSVKGRAMSTRSFYIPTSIALSPTNESLAVGASLPFHATVISSMATQLVWAVNGGIGGNATVGTISTSGLYTAPAEIPSGGVVTVSASLATNFAVMGGATVTILPPPPTPAAARVLASVGGVVQSREGRAFINIPGGALLVSTQISVTELHGINVPPPPAGRRVLGAIQFGPSGLVFGSPAQATIPLSHSHPAGTQLPLQFYGAGGYSAETVMATVTANGDAAVAPINHFSIAVVHDAAPASPPTTAPAIASIEPDNGLEGLRVPVYLTGSGFTSDLEPRVFSTSGFPAPEIEPETLYVNLTNAALVLKIRSITNLTLGETRTYELRLVRPNTNYAAVNFTVRGLPEVVVPFGQTIVLNDSPPGTNSEIIVDGTLRIMSGYWNVECTGDVIVNGTIDAKGADGANANNSQGGARGLHGGAGGQGRSSDCDVSFVVSIGCAPEANTFGENGNDCIGLSANNAAQGACRPFVNSGRTVPEGLGGYPGENLDSLGKLYDLVTGIIGCAVGNFADCARAIADSIGIAQDIAEIAQSKYVGKRGFGAVASSAPVASISQLPETGGGGGAGGGMIMATVLGSGVEIYGGGGGAGGDGGRDVRIVTPGVIDVTHGRITSEGGKGGDGSSQGSLTLSIPLVPTGHADGIPALPGGGGGGGSGGLLLLFSGANILSSSPTQTWAGGGPGGSGGYTWVDEDNGNVGYGFRADSASQGAGGTLALRNARYWTPDHTAPLRTMVTPHQLMRVRVDDFSLHPQPIFIQGETDSTSVPVFTDTNGFRYADLTFFPGFNKIGTGSEVFDLRVLVLFGDSDGDNLADADELYLGTDPNNPDTDGDGLKDGHEVFFSRSGPKTLDTDGDGLADGAEVLFLSTSPTNANVNVAIPPGVFFTHFQSAAGSNWLALINPLNGIVAPLGSPTSGPDFGMVFDETASLLLGRFQQMSISANPLVASNGVISSTSLGNFGAPDSQQVRAFRLAFDPTNHIAYGIELGSSPPYPPTSQLLRIDPCIGPTGVVRVGLPSGSPYHALAFDSNGRLFASRESAGSDHLVRIDPATGNVLQDIGAIGFTNVFGLTFDEADALFGTAIAGVDLSHTLSIDPATGPGTQLAVVNKTLFDLDVAPCPEPCLQIQPGPGPGGNTLPVGGEPVSIVLVDLNEDNHLDLITANSGGTLSVLLGNGSGGFAVPVIYSLAVPGTTSTFANQLAVGDVNGDSHLDVVVSTASVPNTYRIAILQGTGNGTLLSPTRINASAVVSMTLADLNHDGSLDLAAGIDSSPSGVQIYTNSGNGTFFRGKGGNGESGYFLVGLRQGIVDAAIPRWLAVGDVDEDTHPDVVTGNGNFANYADVSILHGDGSARFTNSANFHLGNQGGPVVLADLNADSHLDIVAVTRTATSFVHVLNGNGTGSFIQQPDIPYGQGQGGFNTRLALADLTGDGQLDLVGTISYSLPALGEVVLMPWNPCVGSAFKPGPIHKIGLGPLDLAVGDLNHDGHLDVVAPISGGAVSVLLGGP